MKENGESLVIVFRIMVVFKCHLNVSKITSVSDKAGIPPAYSHNPKDIILVYFSIYLSFITRLTYGAGRRWALPSSFFRLVSQRVLSERILPLTIFVVSVLGEKIAPKGSRIFA